MKKDKDLHREIEETLQSLDGLERAEARPFFYTRLEGRMEQSASAKRPVFPWQWAALALILLINVAMIFRSWPAKQAETPVDYVSVFSEEYGLDNSDTWGLTN